MSPGEHRSRRIFRCEIKTKYYRRLTGMPIQADRTIIVYTTDHELREKAADLAEHLKKNQQKTDILLRLPGEENICAETEEPSGDRPLFLCVGTDGLSLTDGKMTLREDFRDMLPRIRPANLAAEPLLKAARIRNGKQPPTAVDATAGLGEDSFLLAAAGFSVCLFEKDPVIAALLRDALSRAASDPELAGTVSRMKLVEQDSIEALRNLDPPDVILLDPMFPKRRKSGLVGKKFQILHRLEQPCDEEEALLRAALEAGPVKIVIKRPLKEGYLAGVRPGYSLNGKKIRYDIIPCSSAKE